MSAAVYETPDPVPVAKDTLDPPRDFCATMVDAGIMNRDNPITSLVVEIAHPVVDDETEIEIEEEMKEEMENPEEIQEEAKEDESSV